MGDVVSGTCSIREAEGENPREVLCYLGPRPPRVTDAYAEWEVITRPRRKSITQWNGVRPLRVELDLLIDYFNSSVDTPGLKCEQDMRNLELLAGATAANKRAEHPPLLHWDANMMHDNRHAPHVQWVIETLEWGELVFNNQPRPNTVRAPCRVVLMEWVEDQFITQAGAERNRAKKPKKGKKKNKKKPTTYTVTLADTQREGLKTIAKKLVGDPKRWREIARIQKPPIRDPLAIRPNQVLKRPKGW